MSAWSSLTTDAAALGRIAPPEPGRWAAEAFVAGHLGHLLDRRSGDLPASSSTHRGGQRAAADALAAFDVEGYAARRDEAYPLPRRSVSGLSPWIRHGLLDLQVLWDHVDGGPDDDVRAFRGALLRQEYARHLYARTRPEPSAGVGSFAPAGAVLRSDRPAAGDGEAQPAPPDPSKRPTTAGAPSGDGAAEASAQPGVAERTSTGRGWDRRMGCIELALDELEEDGWLVNEARRWLANHWVASGAEEPDEGEDYFFRHLLDGSRAANRLGWSAAQVRPFTRWDVEERAAGLCASCDLVSACPIERPRPALPADGTSPAGTGAHAGDSASDSASDSGDRAAAVADPDVIGSAGPRVPRLTPDGPEPEYVWLTAESLGDDDPALAAHPDLPAVFVFDEPLLDRLRLSSKRLVFLAETLSDLATRRAVEVHLGDPIDVLAGRPLAATFTPVPGWRRRAAQLDIVATHPWSWLRQPHGGDATTFEAWRSGAA